jgi:hypothetical protein
MLAGRQHGGGYGGMEDSGELLAVTSHVLPLGVGIPSRLPSARGAPPPLPARYRQQAAEPWEQQRGGDGGRIKQAAGAPPGLGRQGRLGATGLAGKSKLSAAASRGSAAAAPRSTWGRSK